MTGQKLKINLPKGSIEIDFDSTVYSPEHSSIDTIALADLLAKDYYTIIDVGCGSGKMAIALKKLHPQCKVLASDTSAAARLMTKSNAERNLLTVEVKDFDLLEGCESVHMVVANLPTYNEEQMKKLPLHGPKEAYLGTDGGIGLYEKLFTQAKDVLLPGGYLIVECQERLQDDLKLLSQAKGFHLITRTDYSFVFIRPV